MPQLFCEVGQNTLAGRRSRQIVQLMNILSPVVQLWPLAAFDKLPTPGSDRLQRAGIRGIAARKEFILRHFGNGIWQVRVLPNVVVP